MSLRLALCQVNPTVGAITANLDLIVDFATEAHANGADLVVFPEMVVTGYPVEDLALRPSFQGASKQAVTALAARLAPLTDTTIVVGFLDTQVHTKPVLGRPACSPMNALVVIHDGEVITTSAKYHLPNYGVFDEARHFVPGWRFPVVMVQGHDVGFMICEDMWQEGGPVTLAEKASPGLLVSLNGSPYEAGKSQVRYDLCKARAQQFDAPVAYVNLVGGQDELVFDGGSMVVDQDGHTLAASPRFIPHILYSDLELKPSTGVVGTQEVFGERMQIHRSAVPVSSSQLIPFPQASVPVDLGPEEEVYQALVLGLRDYVRKNGFSSVVLGLSGGIDSALCAAIACDALGPWNVYGVSMPSKYSSDSSWQDAEDLVDRTGCYFRTVEIEPMVAAYLDSLKLTGLSEENLQARVRGTTLMGISNQEGHLVLATGNKSELAVGYSTIYGDAVGGFAPLKDVLKTQVWELAEWRNLQSSSSGLLWEWLETPIPPNSITKPPSAELRPEQLDTDSLPDYQLLDTMLDRYVELDASAEDLVMAGFDPDLVERILQAVDKAEFKRRQYPPGTKISSKAFGRDRRLPITSSWRETVVRDVLRVRG